MEKDAVVTIITAIELAGEDKKRLEQRLRIISSKENLFVAYDVNPGIIAGIIIKTHDKIIDGSILNKLEKLKLKLTGYGSKQVGEH